MIASYRGNTLSKTVFWLLIIFSGGWGASNTAFADINKGLIVMTQNLYDGTDRTGLLEATTLDEFVGAVNKAYTNATSITKPQARLARIAQEIAVNKVDVVALQEASIWRTGTFPKPPTNVQIDFLNTLLSELQKLNQVYQVAAILPGLDVQLPLQNPVTNQYPLMVRLTDRDAIIVRKDLADRGYQITNLQAQDYVYQASYTVAALGNVPVTERSGWISIDLVQGKSTTRVAATHLNFDRKLDPTIAITQANELIATAGASNLRTVLLGDFNSNASNNQDPTYQTVVFQSWILH